MPNSTRDSSIRYHAIAQQPALYYSSEAAMQSTLQSQVMAQQQASYQMGGPVRHPMMTDNRQYHQPQVVPASSRPSSGAWTPTDDQTLMQARANSLNWGPIQQAYFPNKTPNACRKRHERLMERRNADDWDGIKLENLAREYMIHRKEIWSVLAERTGEKWNVVEAKCMSSGLKNLQSASRSGARRERLESSSSGNHHAVKHSHRRHHSHNSASYDASRNSTGAFSITHTDDSAIDLDDMEAEYVCGPDGAAGMGYSPIDDGRAGSSHSPSSLRSAGAMSSNGLIYRDQQSGVAQGRPQYTQRLPSMDMGIGAIINRPGGV